MRLFDLIKQNHAVGAAAHRLCQLAALLIADVSGRRTDQTRHGELLHVLRHINPHQILLVVKQRLGQCLCKLRLANACRAKEQERAKRPVRILNARAAAKNCVRHTADSLVLSDHTLVENLRQAQQLLALALHQLAGGNTRPALDNLGNLLLSDLVAKQARFLAVLRQLFLMLQLLFRLWQIAVHQLCGLFQIVVLLCGFNLAVDLLNLFTQLLHAANRVLFVFPLRFHGVELVALFGQLLLQLTEPSL